MPTNSIYYSSVSCQRNQINCKDEMSQPWPRDPDKYFCILILILATHIMCFFHFIKSVWFFISQQISVIFHCIIFLAIYIHIQLPFNKTSHKSETGRKFNILVWFIWSKNQLTCIFWFFVFFGLLLDLRSNFHVEKIYFHQFTVNRNHLLISITMNFSCGKSEGVAPTPRAKHRGRAVQRKYVPILVEDILVIFW